ncbi:MAG: TlpA family protein disulfide reductase [Raineya sp.]|jgi:thiol-disulfide isomerase/thioredoxin|nr:TlpA family protein disulfide reductase [Raineya sp.]
MKAFCFGIVLFIISFGLQAQDVEVIKKPQMMQMLAPQDNSVYVINFWATWCAPCVKELPAFKQLAENNKDVKILMISLDFAEDIEKTKKLLNKKQIGFKTYLLDETKYDTWINDVEPSWQGAIPVTIILKGKKRIFINEETTLETLEKKVKSIQ